MTNTKSITIGLMAQYAICLRRGGIERQDIKEIKRRMKILIACEFSGIVREAFAAHSHDAWSCDLLDTEKKGNHIIGDVSNILNDGWDMMIAHPPCTFLCVTSNKWMGERYRNRFPNRQKQRDNAITFFMELIDANIPKICIENPVGIMSTHYQKPNQYIQPYQFGHPQSKKTGLWLKNLPLLKPTNKVSQEERIVFKSGNTMSKWYLDAAKLSPQERLKKRSTTFQGIADAMADQWG